MTDVLAKAARGEAGPVTRMTVDAYLDLWLSTIKPSLSPAAWTNYRTAWTGTSGPGSDRIRWPRSPASR